MFGTRMITMLFSVLILLLMPTTVPAQSQLGKDIDGEAANDESGWSVSMSSTGNRLAIGAQSNDGNGFDSGHVRVYQWSGTAWQQLGDDIDGEAIYDDSGWSVSMSANGERLAIGARDNDGSGFSSGHVRVYQWSGTDWDQLGNDIDGESAYDYFGVSVSMSSDGKRLAIGANGNDGNGFDSGHVRVFQWSGSSWDQLGDEINGEAAYDESGWSVSMSSDGNHLAIGARGNDGNGLDSGHVRVFEWSGAAWVQLGDDINGEAFGDDFGWSVSLAPDGGRLAVGGPFNINNSGINAGHVRVFQWSGSAWVQLGNDIDGEAAYDESGGSVSLASDGNRLVIGASRNDDRGMNSGHARIYQWSGTTWEQLGSDINGEMAEDSSGNSVSISSDSNRLAIGARWNDGNGPDSGHVRVYDLSLFDNFKINPGLNDAWYNPLTDGQGFFITVFPDLNVVSLAWFTYDTELPPEDAQANLGDPGHRWLTALGPITGNQARMNIEMTSGGLFDTATEITLTDPPGSDGTIILTFNGCNSGSVEYDIPSINRHNVVPIRRVANDNIVICEALN
ncbi:WD40 repeat domain-containing protein [Pseudomonadota bacterium]